MKWIVFVEHLCPCHKQIQEENRVHRYNNQPEGNLIILVLIKGHNECNQYSDDSLIWPPIVRKSR